MTTLILTLPLGDRQAVIGTVDMGTATGQVIVNGSDIVLVVGDLDQFIDGTVVVAGPERILSTGDIVLGHGGNALAHVAVGFFLDTIGVSGLGFKLLTAIAIIAKAVAVLFLFMKNQGV